MMRAATLLAALSAVAGCSLLNAPDRGLIPNDGGVDPIDAPDGPPPEAGGPEICDLEGDEDGDGAADCADFDCTTAPICCVAGASASLTFDWSAEENGDWGRWTSLVPALGEDWPSSQSDGLDDYLTDFGSAGKPNGIVTKECLPLALGRSVEFPLRADKTSGDEFAAVSFTAVRAVDAGQRVPGDFTIELTGDGELRAKVGSTAVGTTATVATQQRHVAKLSFIPGGLVGGRPYLLVRADVAGVLLVDDLPLIPMENLVTEVECAGVPGLYLAVEGLGDAVGVGELETDLLECANLSQFRAVAGDLAQLDATTLASDGWAGGGLGAPSVFLTDVGDPAETMHVFFDGTSIPRDLEMNGAAVVGFAVGHAAHAATWTARGAPPDGAPVVGHDPPACAAPGPGCPDAADPSVREPAALPAGPGDGLLAYAREVMELGAARRNVYAIDVVPFAVDVLSEARDVLPSPTVSPGAPCTSLRDPALARSPEDDADDDQRAYWLFFTCVKSVGKPDIRGVRLWRQGLTVSVDDTMGVVPVLMGDALGEFAEGGVFAPEVVAEVGELGGQGTALLRLWFLARNRRRTATTVGLAQWRARKDTAPAFEPYPGNPVLREGSPALAACDEAGTTCALGGWSVARRDADTLRIVLARTVLRAGGASYHLEALEQTWKAPTW